MQGPPATWESADAQCRVRDRGPHALGAVRFDVGATGDLGHRHRVTVVFVPLPRRTATPAHDRIGLPEQRLSRLMTDGVGKGFTREDHPALASQLFACYAYVKRVRALADVIGEEELNTLDKTYLKFGEAFERRFLQQPEYENRSIATTLDLGWDVLSLLPREELHRVSDALVEEHYHKNVPATENTPSASPTVPASAASSLAQQCAALS